MIREDFTTASLVLSATFHIIYKYINLSVIYILLNK